MTVLPITSVSDPRIAPYAALKDRDVARAGDRFIAESEFVVRRLLASDFPIESVFLEERRVEEIAPLVPGGVPVYSASKGVMREILGFKFHSGVIACGIRKPWATIEEVCAREDALVVVCPDLNNAENLGGIVRLAAGFGASGMVIGPESVDPFWRQSIRVSMGNVFSVPIVKSQDLVADLKKMGGLGVETVATILDEQAEALEDLAKAKKAALVFGGEAQGLSDEVVAACARRATIPMKLGTDSLNVAVAAGIFLYHLTRVARPAAP